MFLILPLNETKSCLFITSIRSIVVPPKPLKLLSELSMKYLWFIFFNLIISNLNSYCQYTVYKKNDVTEMTILSVAVFKYIKRKRIYQIQCVRLVSGITLIRYAQSNNTGMPNKLKVFIQKSLLEQKKPKGLSRKVKG